MHTLVVYESMWGNTAMVAEAVARGLGGAPVRDVEDVSAHDLEGLDLVVIGGPTHTFSMTRRTTRQEAHRQGATRGNDARGIRELFAELPANLLIPIATFDTRVAKVKHLPGSASKAAAKDLQHHHHTRVAARESFYVEDSPGPLLPGELERAEAWGADLAVTQRSNRSPGRG